MTVAFHEVRFPEEISEGCMIGPSFKTNIVELQSGFSKKNIEWSKARMMYDVAHGLKDQAQLDELLQFFYNRFGRAYGFRFKDPSDFKMGFPQSIGTTDGTTATYQIYKRYSSGGYDYDRILKKIVDQTLSLRVGGNLITIASGAGNATVDITTGIITLGSTLKATPAQDIEIQYLEFDVPCEFGIDQMFYRRDNYNNYTWGQIPVREIRL